MAVSRDTQLFYEFWEQARIAAEMSVYVSPNGGQQFYLVALLRPPHDLYAVSIWNPRESVADAHSPSGLIEVVTPCPPPTTLLDRRIGIVRKSPREVGRALIKSPPECGVIHRHQLEENVEVDRRVLSCR
jgi:hypothetical protein